MLTVCLLWAYCGLTVSELQVMRHTLYMPYFHSMRANSGHERSPMRILKGLAAKSGLPSQEKDAPLFEGPAPEGLPTTSVGTMA